MRKDKVIPARRPGIVLIDKTKGTTTIIAVAVCLDWNVKDKEDDILKLQDHRIEILKLRNIKAKVIPIILGSLGATSMNFEKYLREIPGNHYSTSLIKSAFVGANILRRH